jgi:hypothetical protein
MKLYIDETSWHGQNWCIDASSGQIFCTKKKYVIVILMFLSFYHAHGNLHMNFIKWNYYVHVQIWLDKGHVIGYIWRK